MKAKPIGIIIIVIGIIMIIFTGFNFTTTDKVVDLGPVQINKETEHPVRWTPVIGIVLIVGGIVIIAGNRKRGSSN